MREGRKEECLSDLERQEKKRRFWEEERKNVLYQKKEGSLK